ncbi:Aspartic-type endopeptidase [Lasiodiplodia theobromae]|uniref:Aspartic-type endopeptidase n=1 Tax=Lasiodiplodia theobromae TaxID=45133 RepID=UPI0015C2C2C7|nr:Aspartic-type endopeptidase [Lasiodiplodia theobromae]KAF4541033.1 Aspartic-type endopeptidase [Lasiodiplodia theobromae]
MISNRLATLASLTSCVALSQAASPWPITFSSNETVGPDGPWNVITFNIDFPDQTQWFLPSLLETSVIVNASACTSQQSNCQSPATGMWKGSGAQLLRAAMNSATFGPDAWNDEAGIYTTAVMGLEGTLRYVSDRFTLSADGDTEYLNMVATAVADNVSVTYPGGQAYTLDVGYLSLYGGAATFNWTAADGETAVSQNLTLPRAYNQSAIPSISYGLHVGSAAHGVPGSLYWGGYDQARVIGDPVSAAADNGFFSLVDVSLGVESGESALLNTTSSSVTGLLDTSTATSLTTRADPGVPYLYLPGSTCASIAAHLPVNYDADYGLYIWDTTADSYEQLVTSPHHLSFTFASNTTIAVPLALLNLTLSSRVTDSAGGSTYFPCRPYTATSSSDQQPEAILGRAFLQAAFLGQNWQSGATWLAQAPGPAGINGNGVAEEVVVKTIEEADTELTRTTGAPGWAETWKGVLNALEEGEGGSTTTDTGSDDSESVEEGLSAGAKAGVGVGAAVVVVGVVVGVVWWLRRGKKDNKTAGGAAMAAEMGSGPEQQHLQQQQPLWGTQSGELAGREVVEMAGGHKWPGELESYHHASELDAGHPGTGRPA